MGRSLTLGRCLLLLLFLLSLPVPRLGSEDGERMAAFSLQRLGHGLGLAPQDGKGGGGAVGMEEGNGVKQRRDEVGSDRETELKPVGLPAVRKREEG